MAQQQQQPSGSSSASGGRKRWKLPSMDRSAVPEARPELEELGALGVAAYEPEVLETEMLQQLDGAVAAMERKARREKAEKLQRERREAMDELQRVRQTMADALAPRTVLRDATERASDLKDSLKSIEKELSSLRALERLKDSEAKDSKGQRLVQQGVLTPFERAGDTTRVDYVVRHPPSLGKRQRQSSEREHSEQDKTRKRSAGAERNQHPSNARDNSNKNSDSNGDDGDNSSGDNNDSTRRNDMERSGHRKDASLCEECEKLRNSAAMQQVLALLGNASLEEVMETRFDVVRLLRACGNDAGRAARLIFGRHAATLDSKYPPTAFRCSHAAQVRNDDGGSNCVVSKRRTEREAPWQPTVKEESSSRKREKKRRRRGGRQRRGGANNNAATLDVAEANSLADARSGVEEDGEMENDGDAAEVIFDRRFVMSQRLYDSLFDFQRTGIRWLWELHKQRVGGILADEMGLGKTVQIAAFFNGLQRSGLLSRASLIVCPATVMQQWISEFARWAPSFSVTLFHSSNAACTPETRGVLLRKAFARRGRGVVVTTYQGLRGNPQLLAQKWDYAVLDEGHKIRNPDADITIACKQLNTYHRIILSGSPIQNSLKELWSLFDFVFPGKLGTLPIFQNEFEIPINIGGYANASPSQVHTAYKCSLALRDLIRPYLLRRLKLNVSLSLPSKKEQVMMCRLTERQVGMYRAFLASDEMSRVLAGRLNALYGISMLRKICNHPHLALKSPDLVGDAEQYGAVELSGKLQVLHKILPLWKRQGHRALIFTQSVQMLNILEHFVGTTLGYSYRRMDGQTAIKSRSGLIERYNTDASIFAFLLTTRVGGIGVNLTGADRVVIFDPDWNPSTDVQARERSWRIGQEREVVIYRLITSGTIEEKIYHRQIYKTFLTQKVLNNPRQRRFFHNRDMKELFTLGLEYSVRGRQASSAALADAAMSGRETLSIFSDLKDSIMVEPSRKERNGEALQKKKRVVKVEEEREMEKMAADNARGSSKSDLDDDELLASLLSAGTGKDGAGVRALNHDALVNNAPDEYDLLEREANDVAQQSVRRLLASQSAVFRSNSIVTPTWTGRRGRLGAVLDRQRREGNSRGSLQRSAGGEAGKQSAERSQQQQYAADEYGNSLNDAHLKKGRGVVRSLSGSAPISSASLISALSENAAPPLTSFSGTPEGVTVEEDSDVARGRRFARTLTRFLLEREGSASSADILAHFQPRILQKNDQFLFRSVLREMCDFDKGRKVWNLREEFIEDRIR